jgi:hypothetical protein
MNAPIAYPVWPAELDDYSGTLADLRAQIDKLIAVHGPHARIATDAGYNNVQFRIDPPTEIGLLDTPGKPGIFG